MKNLTSSMLLTAAAIVVALPVYASPMGNPGQGGGGVTGNDCSLPSINLKSMTTINDLNSNLLVGTPYNAHNCVGLYADPNNIGSKYNANPNIGFYKDGLLNGGYYDVNGSMTQLVSPTAFITDEQLMDLQGTGDIIDPGWISLGKFDLNSDKSWKETYFSIMGSAIGTYNLAINEVLSISFTCDENCSTGSWSLITKENIIDDVQGALGNRSAFDHLAFAFKAGPEWAVYDFDFNQIFANESGLGNDGLSDPFNTPFAFFGDWNTGDFNKEISHFAVFARDPILPTTQVPAPATLAIMGLGLLVLRLFRR